MFSIEISQGEASLLNCAVHHYFKICVLRYSFDFHSITFCFPFRPGSSSSYSRDTTNANLSSARDYLSTSRDALSTSLYNKDNKTGSYTNRDASSQRRDTHNVNSYNRENTLRSDLSSQRMDNSKSRDIMSYSREKALRDAEATKVRVLLLFQDGDTARLACLFLWDSAFSRLI